MGQLIETRDGIVLEVPDGMAIDAPEVKEAVATERNQRRQRSPEFKAKVQQTEEQMRRETDPTAGMSGIESALANLGAGISSAGQGARQIGASLGLAKPVPDEEVLEKRARDEALARSTEMGIGPDWMPSAGSAVQTVGNILPSLAVPAGPATGAAASVLPRALQAMVATPIRAGATGGAVSGALQPVTSEESRTMNTGLGAAGGAVLPAAVSAYRGARRLLSPPARAGERLARAAGEDIPDVAQAVAQRQVQRAGQAPAVRAIPESLAEASGHPGLARIEAELGRSPATADEMTAFGRAKNVGRFEAVQAATGDAERLAGREAARTAVSDPARQAALQAASQDQFFHVPAVQAAQRVMASDASANPAVRRVADFVMSSMDERAGAAITPGRLHEVRKVLVDRLEGPAVLGDDMSAAVKGAQRETMELVRGIDEALDTASGGRWDRWRGLHTRASRSVNEAEAAQLARGVFEREGIGELGGAPEVTQTRLGAAMRASRGPESRRFPLAMSASGQQQMDDVLEQVTRANEVQKARKLAGTAGGGSQSSTDLEDVIRQVGTRTGLPLIGPIMDAVGVRMTDATKIELARLVQNPDAAMVAIRQAQRLRQPLSEAQQLLLQATSRAGASLPLALQSQQRPQ